MVMLTFPRGFYSRRLSMTAAVQAASPLPTMRACNSSGHAACSPPSDPFPALASVDWCPTPIAPSRVYLHIFFFDFRAHGPRMRIEDLSAPTARFDARVSAFVGTGGDRLSCAPFWPAVDATFTPVLGVPFGATPQDLHQRIPTPPSEVSVTLPLTCRISTRTRRRTVAAAGAAQPVVDFGFRPGRVPWTSSSRLDPPPRVSRSRLPLAAAPSTSRALTPVPTVPILFSRRLG